MPAGSIDLASAAQSDTLIAATGSQRWRADVTLIPADTGEWHLLSGSTQLAHVQVGVAGGQYTFFGLRAVDAGDDLVLQRVGTLAMGGQYTYRITGAA